MVRLCVVSDSGKTPVPSFSAATVTAFSWFQIRYRSLNFLKLNSQSLADLGSSSRFYWSGSAFVATHVLWFPDISGSCWYDNYFFWIFHRWFLLGCSGSIAFEKIWWIGFDWIGKTGKIICAKTHETYVSQCFFARDQAEWPDWWFMLGTILHPPLFGCDCMAGRLLGRCCGHRSVYLSLLFRVYWSDLKPFSCCWLLLPSNFGHFCQSSSRSGGCY